MKKDYTIIEANETKVKELIEKLNKRARKIGQSEITYTVNNEYFEDLNKGKSKTPKIVKLLDITINAEVIKIEGFNILASINHTYEGGNIVKTLSDKEIPVIYQTIDGNCQHCNTRRKRKETVLLEDEKGNIIQVGKSCLKDFLGYSINDKLNYMDLLEEIEKSECFSFNDGDSWKFEKYAGTKQILNITNILVKKYGYIKARDEDGDTNPNSTKGQVLRIYNESPQNLTDEEKDILETVTNEKYIDNEVIEAMKWIQEQDSKSDYINNLKVLVKSEFIAHREIGILCSLMACYYKAMNKEQQQKAEKAEVKNEYTGKVGERKDFELIFKKAFGYWSEYGYINIYLFADAEGHEIKWTSQKAIEQEEGEALTIKGTIKAHEEYNGIKQTVLTRCKVMQ